MSLSTTGSQYPKLAQTLIGVRCGTNLSPTRVLANTHQYPLTIGNCHISWSNPERYDSAIPLVSTELDVWVYAS
jgi:hypothetical protein